MFSFFRRTKEDPRDLESVIFDIAEHNRDEDFSVFYSMMAAREVFIPIDKTTVPADAQPGIPHVTGPNDRLVMKTVSISNNGTWASAATQPSHPLLAAGYAGMPWLDFLKMVQKIEEVRGALLQGRTSWVALDKERMAHVLSVTGA